ncbi:hypothetical protein LSUB1_G008053 [Lachnellula subtilissima]|uniref:BTB domain-containing protein n=1 Tax=Lachnellula subtilissima TaxID=602034 RepID=A0A8H8RDQ9_9HELO|nr:hypothetical protein LSUB1_G008053 [Lachnellula subtilissima]
MTPRAYIKNIQHWLTTANSLLPKFSGPQVTIRVGEHGPAYQVSKDILCADSPYFSAMFPAGHFKEGAENAAVLEEIEGVITPRSFQALVQWLYRGRVAFPASLLPMEEISEILEFVRLADMTGVTGIDDAMSERLRLIFASSTPPSRRKDIGLRHGSDSSTAATCGPHSDHLPLPQPDCSADADSQRSGLCLPALPFFQEGNRRCPRRTTGQYPHSLQPHTSSHRSPGQNTAHIVPRHIAYASELHPDNPVRRMVAAAAVEGYLRDPHFAFQAEVKDTPSFAMDLLREVQEVLQRQHLRLGILLIRSRVKRFSLVDE